MDRETIAAPRGFCTPSGTSVMSEAVGRDAISQSSARVTALVRGGIALRNGLVARCDKGQRAMRDSGSTGRRDRIPQFGHGRGWMVPTMKAVPHGLGWLSVIMASSWIGSLSAYQNWLAASNPTHPDPATEHIVKEHGHYMTPAQHLVLVRPFLFMPLLGLVAFLCFRLSGSERSRRSTSWVAFVIAIAAMFNPFGANVAQFVVTGSWTLSP